MRINRYFEDNRFIDRNGRRDIRRSPPGQDYDTNAGSAYMGVMSQMPASAKTAKKRSSPRAYTHILDEAAGQGLAQICDFSLFPRPPPDIEI